MINFDNYTNENKIEHNPKLQSDMINNKNLIHE